MEFNLWTVTGIYGLLCCLIYASKTAKSAVQAYRIKRGRMQMNEWLHIVGKYMDINYQEGTAYSRHALKKWLAEMSVIYFKQVIKDNKKKSE